MVSLAQRMMLLSPKHREDVLLVIHSINDPPSINGVGTYKVAVRSFPRACMNSGEMTPRLGQLGRRSRNKITGSTKAT